MLLLNNAHEFHLPSTSVAYLDNGTTINLAKVAGSPKYMALTERLMRTPPLESGLRPPFWWSMTRLAMKALGLPANREIAVLAKLVADLKAETEAALGAPFGMVVVTAPWQAVWRDDGTLNSDLYDALVLAGVNPWTFGLGGGPVYMGELNTALGASGRWLCEPYGCGDTDEDDTYQGVFFIRLVWLLLKFFFFFENEKVFKISVTNFDKTTHYAASQTAPCTPPSSEPGAFISTHGSR